ncbi:MAG: YdcF family protein [Cyanobacteriota bacterium]|nr:YdcF family protein [Cyanobacteriota bacterium]
MFLLFSKILPPLVYPLGLACLLITAALACLLRPQGSRLWAIRFLVAALLILYLSSNGWVSRALVRSLEWRYLPLHDIPTADAIVVLGGGTRPQIPPRPYLDVTDAGDRILYGAYLWQQGKAPWLIMSGGRLEWLGEGGSPESVDMARLAEAMGVATSAILQDPASLNTYQNAVNVKTLLQTHDLHRIILVTSALHMPRSLGIFSKLGIPTIPAPTDYLTSQRQNRKGIPGVLVDLLPSAEALQATNRALKEYVGWLVYRLKGWL